MNLAFFTFVLLVALIQLCQAVPLRLQKRAAFYIANETACVVDNLVYLNGDPIPTDDPCEACKCRPPGFACVLKDCPKKPGCKAVRKIGECCPEYVCGCEHNGRMYRDGDEIRDSKNPCYTCHCQGSSIACAFVDCFFRVDCAPEYVQDKCCPEYSHCNDTTPPSIGEEDAPSKIITVSNDELIDITTTIPLQTESKVEYVEPENSASNESSEEEIVEVETRFNVEARPILTADISDAIHRFAITVSEVETAESEMITSSESTTQSEATTSKSIELVEEESYSPIVEVNEKSNEDEEVENETKLLKTDLDLNDSENNKAEDFSTKENVFTSTTINFPEANSELFATTEAQFKDELVLTSETTEENIQTNFPDVTETPLLVVEEVEKETNEIKRFRSLNNNITDDSTETTNIEVKNDTDIKISNESINAEIKEFLESTESKIKVLTEIDNQKPKEEKTIEITETVTLSHIPEDKIAEFLISLKKTSPSITSTNEPVSDSSLTTISFNSAILDNTSEIKVESVSLETVTPTSNELTTAEDQQTTNTITSKDVEPNLGRSFSDLVESNDNPETTVVKSETTSQVDLTVNFSTYETTSFQALTTEQDQNVVTKSPNTETENYTTVVKDENSTTLDEKVVVNA